MITRFATLVIAIALCGTAGLVTGCSESDGSENSSPATVEEVKAAFQDHGIGLTVIVSPSTKNAIIGVFSPRDSDQVEVTILRTTDQARLLFQRATGRKPEFEMTIGTDIALTNRNVYVLFDTKSSDYAIDSVRDALRDLS